MSAVDVSFCVLLHLESIFIGLT